jgi:predicted  nucleic acid-binding Zn-ribbon protein
MTEFDENTLELLERRLADRIEARVRPGLFRYYAVAGSAVIGVLGAFGWNVMADFRARAVSASEAAIKPVIDNSSTQLKQIIDNSTTRLMQHTQDLDKQHGVIQAQLATIDWLSTRIRGSAEKVDAQLEQLTPKAKLLEELGTRVSDIEQRRRALEADIQRQSSSNATVEISRQVAQLATQVDALFNQIASASSGQPTSTAAATTQTAIKDIAGAAQSTHAKAVEASNQPTVFLQFAGGSRSQAEDLSRALAAKRYVLPDEERTSAAAGRHEIRYFYSQDEDPAKRLAADATEALQSLGYRAAASIEVKDFTGYTGKKPKLATLELWIELPLR